jgi:hypothetical protein
MKRSKAYISLGGNIVEKMVEETMDGYALTVVQEIIETADLELEIQSETCRRR